MQLICECCAMTRFYMLHNLYPAKSGEPGFPKCSESSNNVTYNKSNDMLPMPNAVPNACFVLVQTHPSLQYAVNFAR